MNERQEEYVFREGFRRGYEKGKVDRYKMFDDGTLVVSVADATAVTRVLVEDGQKNGDLYYADRPKGEWIDREQEESWATVDFAYCSECKQPIIHKHMSPLWNFCPNCGADMRGEDNETD